MIDVKIKIVYNEFMFEKMTLQQYNEILASKSPTPGGGSALAVVGTIACSLVEMSINVTLTKLDSQDAGYEVLQRNATFFSRARTRFEQLSNEDALAFRNILDCKHLPKSNEEEISHRESQIQKAYHKAALVPLEVMRIAREALTIAEIKVYDHLYKYVASDCKIGIDLFANIIENSMVNIYANTSLLKDADLRSMLERQGQEIVATLK